VYQGGVPPGGMGRGGEEEGEEASEEEGPWEGEQSHVSVCPGKRHPGSAGEGGSRESRAPYVVLRREHEAASIQLAWPGIYYYIMYIMALLRS